MQFPDMVQAACLFDRRVTSLDDIVRTFMRVEEARTGTRFNTPEARPGAFHRLYGGDDLMITVEYIDRPADMDVVRQPLTSTITGLLCADMRERLIRNRSQILINVSHGVFGGIAGDSRVAALLQQVGMASEGRSLPQFKRRLEVCALLTRIVHEIAPADVVHWTQSNQSLSGDVADTFAAGDIPGHLNVHPYLFGKTASDGAARVGIRTFGARHFIGREVLVEPSILPWAANYETILAFLRVATMAKGYVIPHGDTFGPDDGSLSYRVLHREPVEGDVPLFDLVPLLYRDHGFQADDYVPRDRVFDDRRPPAALMPPDQDAKQDLIDEWREKRALAEGIGGQFEVRARHGDVPTPPASPPPRFGVRGVFGRKGLR